MATADLLALILFPLAIAAFLLILHWLRELQPAFDPFYPYHCVECGRESMPREASWGTDVTNFESTRLECLCRECMDGNVIQQPTLDTDGARRIMRWSIAEKKWEPVSLQSLCIGDRFHFSTSPAEYEVSQQPCVASNGRLFLDTICVSCGSGKCTFVFEPHIVSGSA